MLGTRHNGWSGVAKAVSIGVRHNGWSGTGLIGAVSTLDDGSGGGSGSAPFNLFNKPVISGVYPVAQVWTHPSLTIPQHFKVTARILVDGNSNQGIFGQGYETGGSVQGSLEFSVRKNAATDELSFRFDCTDGTWGNRSTLNYTVDNPNAVIDTSIEIDQVNNLITLIVDGVESTTPLVAPIMQDADPFVIGGVADGGDYQLHMTSAMIYDFMLEDFSAGTTPILLDMVTQTGNIANTGDSGTANLTKVNSTTRTENVIYTPASNTVRLDLDTTFEDYGVHV